MERHWAAVQDWLGELLVRRGMDRISAEELTVPPGLDELFSLLEIRRHHDEGDFDGDRRRLRADGRDAAAALVPGRRALVAREGLPAAQPAWSPRRARSPARCRTSACSSEVQRLLRNLIAMNEVLRDHEHVSVRLVLTPEKLVIDEARRTFTYLSLYGFLTDAVIANRVLPAEVDGYFGAWRERQAARMVEIEHELRARCPC